ncbi:uncharacterized protein LOC143202392 [Rhynchophorus ferrugineus]|uniref:uncharacterized protein LOC143202392 n=1 Tax=Rhynchophorus ferrugineus TaxID=354439 RepID=UPI003FCE9F57
MDGSFELLSSMSPRLKNRQKTIKKTKPVTVLAVKKHFRRSSIYDKATSTNNEFIVFTDRSQSCSSSTNKEDDVNNDVIVIDSTDSENSPSKCSKISSKGMYKISNEDQIKTKSIEKWLDNVTNTRILEDTFFSQVSTIYGDNEECNTPDRHEVAASSTFQTNVIKRFDEMFVKSEKAGSRKDSEESPSSNKSDTKALEGKSNDQTFTDQNAEEYKSILDSLYGVKWREKQDHIIPKSAPCNKIRSFVKQAIPATEKKNVPEVKGDLKIKQKKLNFNRLKKPTDSPWMKKLQGLCDSDTASDSGSSESDKENQQKTINSSEKSVDSCEEEISSDEEYDLEVTRLYQQKSKQPVNKERTYSFLESLSVAVPISKCDISARIFRSSFKTNKDKLVEKLFSLYNDKVFNGLLPKDTVIEWNNKLRNTAGLCYCVRTTHRNGKIERVAKISLSSKVLDSPERLRDTLIHEMCHAATWIANHVSNGHGHYWKSWAYKAMKTFPEIPPIKRCHTYTINTKYTYTCTGCGYSIGRHSKSLNVERKRCGYCYGKFEVFLNKISKGGDTKSVPATPKKELTGFALFVKQNYALYKEPTKKHADVMKILGQKFSEIKMTK